MTWWCVVTGLLTRPGVRGDLGQVVSSLLASMQPSSRQVQVQVQVRVRVRVLCILGVTTDHTAGRVSRALHQPGGLQSAGGDAAAGGGLQGAAHRLLQAA